MEYCDEVKSISKSEVSPIHATPCLLPSFSMFIVKWTKNVLRHTKAVVFLVKRLISSSKMLFKIDYFS